MHSFTKETVCVSGNGRKIFGVLNLPGIDGKRPIVIFSHGYNGSHDNFTAESEFLAAHGIAAYCFDFCGGSVKSKSGLKTTDMTLFTEKEDLCAVIDHFKTDGRIDEKNIFLFGASQGGLVSAMTAEERTGDIRGLLLLFPAFCIADDWNERFTDVSSIPDTLEFWGMELGRKYFESIMRYEVFKNIGKFDREVLMFNGDQDQIATVAYCEKALTVYPNARLEVFAGEGHGFSEAGNRKVSEMTLEFVKRNII